MKKARSKRPISDIVEPLSVFHYTGSTTKIYRRIGGGYLIETTRVIGGWPYVTRQLVEPNEENDIAYKF